MLPSLALVLTALLMGLAGGPHCVAMCGAACGGVATQDPHGRRRGMVLFQLGRIAGYSALGALAAASMQAAGWLGTHVDALRPLWTMFHVAMLALGLALVWRASQPAWLQTAGSKLWRAVRTRVPRSGGTPVVAGALWAFMPCGLLYSALAVAALAGSPPAGALVMAVFAVASGGVLALGPWAWHRLGAAVRGDWGVRLGGAALAGASGWALWMGLARDQLPWCL